VSLKAPGSCQGRRLGGAPESAPWRDALLTRAAARVAF
jgi:hypothetical protein